MQDSEAMITENRAAAAAYEEALDVLAIEYAGQQHDALAMNDAGRRYGLLFTEIRHCCAGVTSGRKAFELGLRSEYMEGKGMNKTEATDAVDRDVRVAEYRQVMADLEALRDRAWVEYKAAHQRAGVLSFAEPAPHSIVRFSEGTEEAARARAVAEV